MKILTFNLRHDADRWAERYPLVVQALREQDADIIGFQEAAISIRQAHLIADALHTETGTPPYGVYVQPKWGENSHEGIALLTRLPVVEVDAIDLPEGGRVAQRLCVIDQGRPLNIVNTHLHHLPEDDEYVRLPQMQAILAWLAALTDTHPNEPWVCVGDFNAQPHSATIQAAAKTFTSAYRAIHGADPLTFPTPLVKDSGSYPRIAIDYVFVDPAALTVVNAALIGTSPAAHDPSLYPSDHFGIAAELSFNEAPLRGGGAL